MALAVRQGTALATFSQPGLAQVKTLAEARSNVIDVDKIAKLAEDVTGKEAKEGDQVVKI